MNPILRKQFCIDMNVDALDDKHLFTTSSKNDAMRYWARTDASIIICNGQLLVRTDDEALTKELKETYETCQAQWFGEIQNLRNLETLLNKHGYNIRNYAPFYTPKENHYAIDDELDPYFDEEILKFKGDKDFSQPFVFDESQPDLIGVSITIDDEIVGVAGLNRTGQHALEIGIQMKPDFQGKGYATRLVKGITALAQKHYPDDVITYGTQFTHNQSINVAIRSGFIHTWSEIMITKTKEEELS